MTEFREGDEVMVKKGLKIGEYDDCCSFTRHMRIYCGRKTKITEVGTSILRKPRYRLSGISDYVFTESMLKLVKTNWKKRLSR